MKKKYKVLFVSTCFLLLNILQGFSQATAKDSIAPSIVNATGGSFIYNKISYEWSIGEATTIETMASGGMVVTTGILQPAGSATRNLSNTWTDDEIKIYPIPASDWLTINFLSVEVGRVTLRLYDTEGRLVYFNEFHYSGTGQLQMIKVSNYASGNYFLNIDLVPNIATQSIQKNRTYTIQVFR